MKTAHFLRSDLTISQDLSLAPLNHTFNFGRKVKIESINVASSVPISEQVSATIDMGVGSAFDTLIWDVVLVAESSARYKPQGEENLQSSDKLKVQCTNANFTGTVYVTVKTSEM